MEVNKTHYEHYYITDTHERHLQNQVYTFNTTSNKEFQQHSSHHICVSRITREALRDGRPPPRSKYLQYGIQKKNFLSLDGDRDHQ